VSGHEVFYKWSKPQRVCFATLAHQPHKCAPDATTNKHLHAKRSALWRGQPCMCRLLELELPKYDRITRADIPIHCFTNQYNRVASHSRLRKLRREHNSMSHPAFNLKHLHRHVHLPSVRSLQKFPLLFVDAPANNQHPNKVQVGTKNGFDCGGMARGAVTF
jgi:hypothetical protein